MAEENSKVPVPGDADETRTRKTVRMKGVDVDGASIPKIDLNQAPAPGAVPAPGDASNTVTRRTLKLQNLAKLGVPAPKPVAPAPAAAPQAAAPAASGDDTRTRRTVKLSTLAAPKIEVVRPAAPKAAAPAAPKPAAPVPAAAAPQAAAPAAPPTVSPAKQTVNVPGAPDKTVTRRTQKLNALDTQDVVAAVTANDVPSPDPETQTRRTRKLSAVTVEPAAKPPAPAIDLNAPAAPEEPFRAANVDDTVKLQRPAPRATMPGSVTPAAQGTPSAGGIKLNRPKPAIPTPVEAPKSVPKEAAPEKEPAEKPAEPTGNLGKDQTPPKKKSGLKVNMEALAGLGSAPMLKEENPEQMKARSKAKAQGDSTGALVCYAVFLSLAALLMIFIALVATTDYFNIWHPSDSGKMELPIISDQVIKYHK